MTAPPMAELPEPQDFSELLAQAKSGDALAFEKVYGQFFVPIYRYIARRINNRDDTEDLVQQVFLKLLTSQSTFTPTASAPLAYLFTIARNAVIDYWHKQGRHEILSSDFLDEIPDTREIPVTQDIEQALAILSPEQRGIIELKFHEGLTTSEIATRFGKTEAAIRQIQCRALKLMRTHLTKSV